MLINLRPKAAVELNVVCVMTKKYVFEQLGNDMLTIVTLQVIEECEDRLNETQQQELLDIIRETFPYQEEKPPAEVNGIHDDGMEE